MNGKDSDLTATDASDAFVAQLMRHRHALYAFIAKQLINPADVEDVFQKTSVVLWKKMADYDAEREFFPWACGVAYNEVRNFLTVQRRGRLHFDAELVGMLAEEAEQESETTDARLAALENCMQHLSPRQQDILQRWYAGTRSITEVAETVGHSRGALYKQLERLRLRLLQCIRMQVAGEAS